MDDAPTRHFTARQDRYTASAASSSSPDPSLSYGHSQPFLDEAAGKKGRRYGRGSENYASGRQGYDFTNSSASGNARAHFGDQYSHVYNYNRDPSSASWPNHERDLDVVTQIMESLSFAQMGVRCETISRAHANTCKWISSSQEYLNWRDKNLMSDHGGFLWIKSRPGAGKSTLMKFLLLTAHDHIPGDTVISFFFNAQGQELERSLEGCYRALLHQMLTNIPRLSTVLTRSNIPSKSLREWSLDSLQEMLSEAILLLGADRLTCFIDALDECPEADIRDMIDYFEELGELAIASNIRFRICLSSRYYPRVSIARCQHMQLDQQEGHQQDIAKYVGSKLKVRRGKTAEELRVAVQDKAHGIFMWVVLVVRILNEESDRGSNNTGLRRCLERIPSELHELFRDILQRGIQDDQNLVPILQWISFARRPLTREELYFAVLSGKPDFTPSVPWDPNEDGPEAMDLFILNASKGLAKTSKGKRPRIHFIHESVRDYLHDTGFEILAPHLSVSLQGSAHDYIKHCCYRWISEEMEKGLALPQVEPKASFQELRALRDAASWQFPFLEYSVNNVLHHAELAWREGVSQEHFIEDFRCTAWIRIHSLFAKYERDRYTAPADTLTCVLAAHKASMLLEAELHLHAHYLRDSQFEAALRVILINYDTETLLRLLESGLSRNYNTETLLKLLESGPSQHHFQYKDFKDKLVAYGTRKYKRGIEKLLQSTPVEDIHTVLSHQELRSFASCCQWLSSNDIHITDHEAPSRLNNFKAFVEDMLDESWNWWPLSPRILPLPAGFSRVRWTCGCGDERIADIATPVARRLKKVLKPLPPWIHSQAPNTNIPSGGSQTRPTQRPNNPTNSSLPFTVAPGTQNAAAATNMGSPSGGAGVNPISKIRWGTGISGASSNTAASSRSHQVEEHLFMIVRRGSDFQIADMDVRNWNDNMLFQQIKLNYKKLRGGLRQSLSWWRYDYSEFFRFQKFAAKTFVPRRAEFPPDTDPHRSEYRYSPRPMDPEPPITKHEFHKRFYHTCDQPSSLHMWHDCRNLCNPHGHALATFPKRTRALEMGYDKREDLWGIFAQERRSFAWILAYFMLAMSPSLFFLFAWMFVWGHESDLQNGSIPLALTISLLAVFVGVIWSDRTSAWDDYS